MLDNYFDHPERRPGEIFLTNHKMHTRLDVATPSRIGIMAYDIKGMDVPRMVPVFVMKKNMLELHRQSLQFWESRYPQGETRSEMVAMIKNTIDDLNAFDAGESAK